MTQRTTTRTPSRTSARSATSPAVQADGLTRTFGSFTAVDRLDLEIPTGIVYGLLGPNGAGKSTTLRMITTLLAPTQGRARVLGHDIVRERHAVRSLIGVTGQYASVDETLTGVENLRLFGRLLGLSRRQARERADELLAAFSLTDAGGKRAGGYSGGMRRRLDLAVSLIAQPPLIFLDEPTTGLDPRTREQMWDVIRSLAESGSTILLTTQYLEEADQLADSISVIDHGHVIAEGTADELKASVGGKRIELTLVDEADTDRARRIVASSTGADVAATGRVLTAQVGDPTAALIAVLTALGEEGVELHDAGIRRPTLDDVFLTLTGHAAEEQEVAA